MMSDDESCCGSRSRWNARQQQPTPDATHASELNALTAQERERIFEEIHGVADDIVETPEMVSSCIVEMKRFIKKLSVDTRKYFDRAHFLDPKLECNDSLYLMYLRAKRFDVKEASQALCTYYTVKADLFGEDMLVEKITLKHLTEEEIRLIRIGAIQLLRGRESTGRVIQVANAFLWDKTDPTSFARFVFYLFTTAAEEDEDLQKRGLVAIANYCGSYSTRAVLAIYMTFANHLNFFPLHFNCIHLCYDDPTMHFFLKNILSVFPRQVRLRQRLYFGSTFETSFHLMAFGMNVKDCFEANNGTLSHEYTNRQLQERWEWEDSQRREEEENARWFANENPCIRSPSKFDILMGRSSFTRDWSGNILLHEMVQAMVPTYASKDQNNRVAKTNISRDLVSALKTQHNSRFLERRADGWYEVDDSVARTRVSQALRNGARNWSSLFHTQSNER